MSESFIKFLVVGGLGFLIDAGLTLGLITIGISPLAARPPAIFAATLFTWLANRQHTFRVGRKSSLTEVVRYASVAGVAALANYLIYSGLVTLSISPFSSIVMATIIVAVFSYFGYKHFAFGVTGKA
jgi:putative flippase GtrA